MYSLQRNLKVNSLNFYFQGIECTFQTFCPAFVSLKLQICFWFIFSGTVLYNVSGISNLTFLNGNYYDFQIKNYSVYWTIETNKSLDYEYVSTFLVCYNFYDSKSSVHVIFLMLSNAFGYQTQTKFCWPMLFFSFHLTSYTYL